MNTAIVKPDPSIFKSPTTGKDGNASPGDNVIHTGAKFHIYQKKPYEMEYPPEGGIYLYFKDVPFPKKGFPYPEAVYLNDTVKRLTMFALMSIAQKELIIPLIGVFAFLPKKRKNKIIETALNHYAYMGEYILESAMIKPERMSNVCRGLHRFIYTFLVELGTSVATAYRCARIFTFMVDYDDSYRLRLEDVLSTTTFEDLTTYPRDAVRTMAIAFMKREKYAAVHEKGRQFLRLLDRSLFVPWIRKAFIAGWNNVGIEWFRKMQLDEADKYHTLYRGDYDFQGLSFEEREKILKTFHPGELPPMVEVLPNNK